MSKSEVKKQEKENQNIEENIEKVAGKKEEKVVTISEKKYLYAGKDLKLKNYAIKHKQILALKDEEYNNLISGLPKLKELLLEVNKKNVNEVFVKLVENKEYYKKISNELEG